MGSGVLEAATLTLHLTGTGEKTKSGEIQPQPVLAKAFITAWGPGGSARRVSQTWG